MIIFLFFLNIALTIFSVWGAVNAFNNTTSFSDVTGIDIHKEAILYLIPVVVAGVSALFPPLRMFAGACAFVIALSGGYVVYDTLDDTILNTYECLGEAGLDRDKTTECVEKITPKT
jgi:hypothetical protein